MVAMVSRARSDIETAEENHEVNGLTNQNFLVNDKKKQLLLALYNKLYNKIARLEWRVKKQQYI